MAEEIKGNGVDVKLIPGERGIFDVTKDGTLIYSKFKTGRFPKPKEIAKLLS